jgi:hypothetical protein
MFFSLAWVSEVRADNVRRGAVPSMDLLDLGDSAGNRTPLSRRRPFGGHKLGENARRDAAQHPRKTNTHCRAA